MSHNGPTTQQGNNLNLNPLEKGDFVHAKVRNAECTPLKDRFSLRGKTAIVTGGAAGIGYAVAQALAEMGANVAIWYNSNKNGPSRAQEISDRYGVICKVSSHVQSITG